MGVTCIATNCAGSYFCCEEDEYQGNIIFKPLEVNLMSQTDNPFSEEEQQILRKIENSLKQSEQERVKIADKFKDLLDYTGAGVLFKPTFERALISFIIYLFEQIFLCAKAKNKEFNKKDFSITNFISKTNEIPFIAFNPGAFDDLKANYEFDINKIDTLSKALRSIINFLNSFTETKKIISDQLKANKELLNNLGNNFRLVTKLTSTIKGIKFISNYYSEIISSILSVQGQLIDPRKIDLFYRIAQDAANKNITDPKELVLIYSLGENCGSVSKWKENLCYKKVDVLKY